MSIQPVPTNAFLVPKNAPFTDEQRAWLSGFLAAAIVPDVLGATALSNAESAALLVPAMPDPLASNDDAPWHDPSLAIEERMRLSEGKPLASRLMAAMAQQDCGQCGYNCADYANAIFKRTEKRLNLCVPGGRETGRLLKTLAAELDNEQQETPAAAAPAGAVAPTVPAAPTVLAEPGRSRDHPVNAAFLSRRLLNGVGSQKETLHIELDVTAAGLDYKVGDSLGLFPKNDTGLVDQIIAMLGASHTTSVRDRTLREVLLDEVGLGIAPDTLFELFSYVSGGAVRQKARGLARGEDPDGDAAHLDVLAVLQKFPTVRPHPEAFVDALEILQPRLYSMASSPLADAGHVSLTVDTVRYVVGKRRRLGVASTFLADRALRGAPIKVYVQKAHNFGLPEDPAKPIVMIGPGTGVAPFRAFLQDREATRATGPNWLFFGHQHQATDFLYRDELNAMKASGVLSRLSLAWSRDGQEKYYVQDRMREVGAELWQWIANGAHVYVCGDAKRMAKDVEGALVEIVATHGVRSTDEAVAFVSSLKKEGRYQADVY